MEEHRPGTSRSAAGVPGPSGLPGRVRTLCSPPPPGRLSSLRTRDLTLGGGFKKTKVRNVSRSKEDVQAAPRKDRRERDERRREGRGRRKDRPQTIQSHSIFEQGPADSGRRAGDGRPRPALHPPPPPLPHSEFVSRLASRSRPAGLRVVPPAGGRCGSARSGAEKPSIAELLRGLRLSGGEELFFMQLPDCMPGRAPTVVLSDFPEGFLGKLQVRRSGKLQLRLGDVVMDVSEGAAFSFLQQLVSVRLSEGNTGDMMVLGNVHHKLVLSPDFQALLQYRTKVSIHNKNVSSCIT
uniref:Uncharacterized protein n=1 Tax=Salarias fasciatus TaxID=181472 RepID=A0A672H666_SALFA